MPLRAAALALALALAGLMAPAAPASAQVPLADGFQHPVGDGSVTPAKDGDGWYVSKDFRDPSSGGYHAGEDWNTEAGGNTDYGKPVRAAAAGTVSYAGDPGGAWGKVVLLKHRLPDGRIVASQYAHLATITRRSGTVARGEKIGTVGTADGRYTAHLHFEIRSDASIPANVGGRSSGMQGFTDPTDFINRHRSLTSDADAPALARDSDGRIWQAAMRNDGSLFVRRWSEARGWSGFARHGRVGRWSVAAGPALVASGERVWLAAVTRSGTLRARPLTVSGAGDWMRIGASGTWSLDAGATLLRRRNGGVLAAAVGRSGSLFTMTWRSGQGWSAPRRRGPAGIWATSAAPSVAYDGTSTRLAAVTAGGRLQLLTLGQTAMVAAGGDRLWATDGGTALVRSGESLVLAAVTRRGTLMTRRVSGQAMSGLRQQGARGVWSLRAAPALATAADGVRLLALRKDGSLRGKVLGGEFVGIGRERAWSQNAGPSTTSSGAVTATSVGAQGSLRTWSWEPERTFAALGEEDTSMTWAR